METRIYIASTISLKDEKLFLKLFRTVPLYRQEKINSYKTVKEKCLSLGTGLLLSKALKDAGIDEQGLVLKIKDNGRPYFQGLEKEFYFSLSHSEERVMCAISPEPIGCDVQFISEDCGVDPETWPKMESYSKATDTSMVDLMSGKAGFSKNYKFLELNRNDNYKYVICSVLPVLEKDIQEIKFTE